MQKFILIVYLLAAPSLSLAQSSDALLNTDSTTTTEYYNSHSSVIGGVSLGIMDPSLGSDLNVFGYGFKFGLADHNKILLITDHAANDAVTGQHRYDYALLLGYSRWNDALIFVGGKTILNAAVGISRIYYRIAGGPDVFGRSSGSVFGASALISYYLTNEFFHTFGGFAGFDLYGSVSNPIVTYFSLEFTLGFDLRMVFNK